VPVSLLRSPAPLHARTRRRHMSHRLRFMLHGAERHGLSGHLHHPIVLEATAANGLGLQDHGPGSALFLRVNKNFSMRTMACRFLVTTAVVLAVQFGARAAQGQPAPSTTTPPVPFAPIAPPQAASRLMLETDANEATLEAREIGQWKGRLGWRPICTAPCGAPLLGGYEFRVAAPTKVTSAPFVLPAGSATIFAQMGSKSQSVTGIVLTSVGGGAMGLSLTLAAMMADCTGELGLCDGESANAALVVAAASALVLGAGIYLIATSRTAVSVSASIPLGGGVALTPSALVF